MLFANTSLSCPSPECIGLEDFDFLHFDFHIMSRKSSSSPGADHDSNGTPPQVTNNEELFLAHGRESPHSENRSPLSAVRSYLLEDRNEAKLGKGVARSHLQESSYNYSVHPDSTLITPCSISTASPPTSISTLAARPGSQTPLPSYQPYGSHYPAISNPITTSAQDETGYSSYAYTGYPLPPDPYWGTYNISNPASAPPPRQRAPVPIAPQPPRLPTPPKRHFEEDISYVAPERGRKRSRNSISREVYPVERKIQEITEDERLLIHLKEERKLPWKDITRIWGEETGHPKNEAALQMQYKRLRERIRIWTPGDVSKLAWFPSSTLKFLLLYSTNQSINQSREILANIYSSSAP